jgi:pimeloyl-ACP methyl ester carboxylesterase
MVENKNVNEIVAPKQVEIGLHGYSVFADLYEAPNCAQVVLILIGYESNKSWYGEIASFVGRSLDASVLVLDYSGHGVSPFNLKAVSPAQNLAEVVATYDWLVEVYPDIKISVIGASYGSYLAANLRQYRNIDKLVVRVPALYPPDYLYTKFGDVDLDYVRNIYRNDQALVAQHPLFLNQLKTKGSTLVVLHEFDEFCPKTTSDAYIKSFAADHIMARGLKHNLSANETTIEQREEYYRKIVEWMS